MGSACVLCPRGRYPYEYGYTRSTHRGPGRLTAGRQLGCQVDGKLAADLARHVGLRLRQWFLNAASELPPSQQSVHTASAVTGTW
jgi:hypothetical protein